MAHLLFFSKTLKIGIFTLILIFYIPPFFRGGEYKKWFIYYVLISNFDQKSEVQVNQKERRQNTRMRGRAHKVRANRVRQLHRVQTTKGEWLACTTNARNSNKSTMLFRNANF